MKITKVTPFLADLGGAKNILLVKVETDGGPHGWGECYTQADRDRSIVAASALIARNQTIGMLHYFNIALDNNVAPAELSEIITHLAFYSGWSNAFAAVAIVKDIFTERGIGTDQLPSESPELLPLNEAAEKFGLKTTTVAAADLGGHDPQDNPVTLPGTPFHDPP